ncbi:MAG TPA: hypothetical protein VFQ70_01005 [Candidatus Saccharimonadaceae bacterium]|nr:hypothetical protein [Candidatus Saccharimonadaceae bacterium]
MDDDDEVVCGASVLWPDFDLFDAVEKLYDAGVFLKIASAVAKRLLDYECSLLSDSSARLNDFFSPADVIIAFRIGKEEGELDLSCYGNIKGERLTRALNELIEKFEVMHMVPPTTSCKVVGQSVIVTFLSSWAV